MRAHADAIEHVSGERIGGGLAADGLGELSKLLLGRHPAKALRLARDTGVLVHVLPEFSPVLGVERANADGLTLDEHVFATVQEGAELGAPLPVRLALLFHDLGKPHDQDDHAAAGARLAARALARLRYPARLQAYVRRLVAAHAFHVPPAPSPLEARRFLAEHGDEPAGDLLVHKRADLRAKRRADELARLEELARLVEAERGSPHRLADLAVDGTDLLALGYRPGPALGRALDALLAEVVDDPGRNERGTLLARAQELL